MTGIVDKVKEVLHKDKDHSTTHSSTTHSSAADPRTTGTTGTTTHGTTGAVGTGAGNYTHGAAGENRGFDGPASRTDGPHSSNLANKADPRIDSDRDASRNAGVNPSGTATTGSHSTTTGTTHGTGIGSHGTHGTTGINAGPHDSKLANQADPRVDHDLDGRGGTGLHSGTTHGTTGLGSHGTHGTTGVSSGTGIGSHGTHGVHSSGTTGLGTSGFSGDNRGLDGPASRTDGPHSSNLANKADPTIDSDRDHSRNLGANPAGTASHGTHDNRGPTGTAGGHSAVGGFNSGTTGTHTGAHGTHGTTHTGAHTGGLTGSSTTATGPAPNTAGPHKSDVLNKADPRIDSDLDGSKTYGGDKTYSRS